MSNVRIDPLPPEAEEIFQNWRKAWLEVDKHAMLALFDSEASDFVYQPEEASEYFRTSGEIKAYWDIGADRILKNVPVWDLRSRVVTQYPGVLAIFAVIYSELIVNGIRGVVSGDLRITMLMREVKGNWKVFHYNEARQVDPAAYAVNDGEI